MIVSVFVFFVLCGLGTVKSPQAFARLLVTPVIVFSLLWLVCQTRPPTPCVGCEEIATPAQP